MNVQQLARQLSQAFEGRERNNGDKFRCLKDGHPDWMRDVVMAAHGDMFPDDWRYRMIEECADAIAELEDGDDPHDANAPEPSVYTAEKTGWLHSSVDRYAYCDEALQEGLVRTLNGDDCGILDLIEAGMTREYEEIRSQLIDALTDRSNQCDECGAELMDDAGVDAGLCDEHRPSNDEENEDA